MAYNPEKHHRHSIRLKGYDYIQPGAYFVTLVTHQRAEIFGEVVNGVMQLSPLGEIVHYEWLRSIGIRNEIQLFDDEFVVMPNHMHGIVRIVETTTVGADGIRTSIIDPDIAGGRRPPQPKLYRAPKSLGSFIAGFKSAVSSRAKRELTMVNLWQRNYYEHIIRTETAFANIWHYIDNNPRKWTEDQLHSLAEPNPFNQG